MPIERYNILDRARLYHYWRIGAVSDTEYEQYKQTYKIAEPLAAGINDRLAMKLLAAMGW